MLQAFLFIFAKPSASIFFPQQVIGVFWYQILFGFRYENLLRLLVVHFPCVQNSFFCFAFKHPKMFIFFVLCHVWKLPCWQLVGSEIGKIRTFNQFSRFILFSLLFCFKVSHSWICIINHHSLFMAVDLIDCTRYWCYLYPFCVSKLVILEVVWWIPIYNVFWSDL